MVRTRFAPSPTGDLHVGGAWTAIAAWALARHGGGETILRMEDIDTPRVVAGSAARIEGDLAWLGLDWDRAPAWDVSDDPRAPYTQSKRVPIYEAALARLAAEGLTYPCDCSRAEIARVASAPHAGEEIVYPGTCRDAPRDREFKRDPAIRLAVPVGAVVRFDDTLRGTVTQDVGREVGDFVLRRGDGVFSYQLAVALDDAAMAITDVIRADDLLGSTARQLLLMRLLGYETTPRYVHLPLVVSNGERLAKRVRSATIRGLAEAGIPAAEIVGTIARALGLVDESAAIEHLADVAHHLRPPSTWRSSPWPLPTAWADLDAAT